jgi:hypothetical protein
MAFNMNFWKGTTPQQAQAALEYWKSAFISNEHAEKMKTEKQKQIEQNAAAAAAEGAEPEHNAAAREPEKSDGNN